MTEKYIGYILLFLGIIIIFLSLLGTYFVFSGKNQFFQVFSLPAVTLDLSGIMQSENTGAELSPQANLETELLKSDIINKPLNLLANILFMSFLLNIGYKTASIGVQLIRPIKVVLKDKIIN